jgi:hypothetical protein
MIVNKATVVQIHLNTSNTTRKNVAQEVFMEQMVVVHLNYYLRSLVNSVTHVVTI